MRINAYEKFISTIERNICSYVVSTSTIIDEKKISNNLKKLSVGGYSFESINMIFPLSKVRAEETVFANGLIRLESTINIDKANSLKQTTVFKSYDEEPLVNIVESNQKLSLEQSDSLIGYFGQNIIVSSVSIDIKGYSCTSSFVTYKGLEDSSFLIERYNQICPLSDCDENSNELARLCEFGGRELEVVYKNCEPVYAQILDRFNVEKLESKPNNIIIDTNIVGKIRQEVDAICGVIATDLTEFQKNKDEKKRVKKD